MTELIDRQVVLEIAMSYCPDDDGSCSKAGHDIREMLDEIETLPTIEVKQVQYGQWLSDTVTCYTGKEDEHGDPEYKEYIFFVCSNCRRKTVVREHFCPRCGSMNLEV